MAITESKWLLIANLLPDCYMPLAHHDGYYWHLKENELYSYKSNKMRKLVAREPFIIRNGNYSNKSNKYYTITNNNYKLEISKDQIFRTGIKYMNDHGIKV